MGRDLVGNMVGDGEGMFLGEVRVWISVMRRRGG